VKPTYPILIEREMNTMDLKQATSQIVPILHLIGLALVIIACLKYFEVKLGFGGGVSETALVGIGLLLAK
jgi:hypothetical protein